MYNKAIQKERKMDQIPPTKPWVQTFGLSKANVSSEVPLDNLHQCKMEGPTVTDGATCTLDV